MAVVITPINASDPVGGSRVIINQNFTNLASQVNDVLAKLNPATDVLDISTASVGEGGLGITTTSGVSTFRPLRVTGPASLDLLSTNAIGKVTGQYLGVAGQTTSPADVVTNGRFNNLAGATFIGKTTAAPIIDGHVIEVLPRFGTTFSSPVPSAGNFTHDDLVKARNLMVSGSFTALLSGTNAGITPINMGTTPSVNLKEAGVVVHLDFSAAGNFTIDCSQCEVGQTAILHNVSAFTVTLVTTDMSNPPVVATFAPGQTIILTVIPIGGLRTRILYKG